MIYFYKTTTATKTGSGCFLILNGNAEKIINIVGTAGLMYFRCLKVVLEDESCLIILVLAATCSLLVVFLPIF